MADYTPDAKEAYDDIKEDGGPIIFSIYTSGDPTDPLAPWEGGEQTVVNVEHVAVFFPLKDTVLAISDPWKESCLIPAYGLDFEVKVGTVLTKADGKTVSVTDVLPLKPDGLTTILYTCGVSEWVGT